MSNSPENPGGGEDMSRLWYAGDASEASALNAAEESKGKYNEDLTYDDYMRQFANPFAGDPVAEGIAEKNAPLEGETSEQYEARIRREAELARAAEKAASRDKEKESLETYNQRVAEGVDAKLDREAQAKKNRDIILNSLNFGTTNKEIVKDEDGNTVYGEDGKPKLKDKDEVIRTELDPSRPIMGQILDKEGRQWVRNQLNEMYPRNDAESIPEWQSRVESEIGLKIWGGVEQSNGAGEGAGDGGAAGGQGQGAGKGQGQGAGEGAGDGGAAGGQGAGEGAGDGGAAGGQGKGTGEGQGQGAGEGSGEKGGEGPLRTDFENYANWSDAEKAAVIAVVNAANKNEAQPNKPEKTGFRERLRRSGLVKKIGAIALMTTLALGLSTAARNTDSGLPAPSGDGYTDVNPDDGDTGTTPDTNPVTPDGGGATGEAEKQYEYSFTDSYFFYNTDARNVEKNSDIAFCNAGEVLTTCIAEHPEWSDFETNKDSYNALMNAAQVKLSETGREYGAVTAWQICKQTNGAYFGDFLRPDMTYDEAEAVVDNMTAEQSSAFFAELLRAQSNSSWSADTLNGSGFTSGIRDASLEGDVSSGFVYNVSDCQEADLIVIDRDFDGVNVQKQVFYDADGNALGAIYVRIDLENATITTDPKGVVSIDDLSCCNVDVPENPPANPPETPPTPPENPPANPPENPPANPPENPPENPPSDQKTPLPDKDGNTQLGLSGTGGTDKPQENADFNPEKNNDGSTGEQNVAQAPNSNEQTQAINTSEAKSNDDSGKTVEQNTQNSDKNGGSEGENTADQKNKAPANESSKAQQAEDNKGKSAEASASANKKPVNKSAEAKDAENEEAKNAEKANMWANGAFDV